MRTVDRMAFRAARLEEIIPLREEVLIRGTTRISSAFDGDDAPGTIHVGAFVDDRCVACASLMRADYDSTPAYQLRGMAVAESHRGRGVGAALLTFCESQIDTPTIWCNAREHAVGFYERMGWQTVGKLFMIEGVCPHLRMFRRLA